MIKMDYRIQSLIQLFLSHAFLRIPSFSQNHLSRDPVRLPEKALPGVHPVARTGCLGDISERPAGFRSPLPEPPPPLSAAGTARSAPYLGEKTTRRGHSLAGYQ